MQRGTDCYVNSGGLNHGGDYDTYYTAFKQFEKFILFTIGKSGVCIRIPQSIYSIVLMLK